VRAYLADFDETTLAHQAELTEIAAPPFGEEVRARRMAELLTEAGALDVTTDEEGNVVGRYPGEALGTAPPLVVAAHLDTVFPAGTDVTVTRSGDLLTAPGISDDGRGLAGLLALCRALVDSGAVLSRPLLLVATVGEEGLGNLRGVRHLFSPVGAGHGAAAFISLDGAGSRGIVHRGLGSRRFRFEIEGPGGHSWSDWGRANPIHALSEGLTSLREIRLPEATTLSVGRIGGGKSINAVPQAAWAELEIRSERESALADLEPQVLGRLEAAIERANDGRLTRSDPLTVETISLGARPAGATPADHPLVRAAVAATDALGREPVSVLSSTDANLPMSLGIPAITVGAGGEAGGAHTAEEWYKNTNGPDGIARAALILMLLERLAS
jgi:acetylornithine deacetylase/succinyl-diaminopimelate desuccinylase-like protein